MSTYTRTTTFGSLSAGNQAASKFDTEFDNIKTAVDDNYSIASGKEPALGNPGTTGYVLSSTDAGVRSWVALPAGSQDFSNIQVFTGSGAWTNPGGITKVIVEAWGGGGGGGGGSSTQQAAGGGAGAYGYGVFSTINGNINVTIGAGGSGGSGGTGSSGGTTTVSGGGMPSGCTCSGGSGGALFGAVGGSGGSAGAGWNLGIAGQRGGGIVSEGTGGGGNSPRGGQGGSQAYFNSGGIAGTAPGGGGAGGGKSVSGGAGGAGIVIIRW